MSALLEPSSNARVLGVERHNQEARGVQVDDGMITALRREFPRRSLEELLGLGKTWQDGRSRWRSKRDQAAGFAARSLSQHGGESVGQYSHV